MIKINNLKTGHAINYFLSDSQLQELSPLLFQFTLPMMHTAFEGNPDAHHVFIENIQTNYNVQVTIHPPNKLQQTAVSVKGCEVDSAKIKEAITKIVRYFSGGSAVRSCTIIKCL